MCGFTGFKLGKSLEGSNSKHIICLMSDTLTHRGPDDSGAWLDDELGVALGFRRLAIQDLSSAGHQPMLSASKRYTMVFNGEIYNHLELRENLNDESSTPLNWKGFSDTETILMAFECWGLKKTLDAIHGMFAFSVIDLQSNELILARDRVGEKPLYYGMVNDSFVFASELKAIKKFPHFQNSINRAAITEYIKYNYIPAPLSIYEGIYKLMPGSFVKIKLHSHAFDILDAESYWSPYSREIAKDNNQTDTEMLLTLESSLGSVINKQMISDVPLGAFLSGGVDSSAVVSIMQSNSMKPIKTFTIGFEDMGFDESDQAQAVAKHLNTDHTKVMLGSSEALDVIPSLPSIYDEPFADSSQIPTFLISKVAKEHVTVALSGDGGDEVFGGYNRYLWAPRIWDKVETIPAFMRPMLSSFLDSVPQACLPTIERMINKTQSKSGGIESLDQKIYKLSRGLKSSSSEHDFYNSLITSWPNPELLVKSDGLESLELPYECLDQDLSSDKHPVDFLSMMMLNDMTNYLPNDILCKVDRASMANSLETRTPFLDHKLIEFAWSMPASMKIRGTETKWALRQILYKYVPQELIDRPKTGFSIPIAEWLRGPLRSWAAELLSEKRLESDGYFYSPPIILTWQQHLSGKYDWSGRLWGILMFQSWLDNQ